MSSRKIYSGAMKLVFGTLLSRVLGFVRELLAARYIGGGHEMDVFTAAYHIPNLLRGILGEKACESAFLPIYKTLLAKNKKEEAAQTSSDTFKIFLVLLLFFSFVMLAFTPSIVTLMGKGFQGQFLTDGTNKFTAAVKMTRALVPLIVMVGIFAFLGARMLALEKFTAYSSAAVISNVFAIAAIVLTYPAAGYYCLAWGVLAGALSECIFYYALDPGRADILGRKIFSLDLRNPNLKEAGNLWAPITLGSTLEKIGTVIETYMASFLGKGAPAALYYGNLLNLLSFSILGLSFNRSIIPHLTEQNATRNHAEFRRALLMGIRMNLILLLPVAVFVLMLSSPIVELFLQRGKFDAEATARTSIALSCYSVGLLAMGWAALFSRAFYAFLDARTPIKISVLTLAVNVTFNFLLWKTELRHAGLALATSIAAWVNAITLLVFLNLKMKKVDAPIHWQDLFGCVWRVFIPTGIMAVMVWFVWPFLSDLLPQPEFLIKALKLVLISVAAGLTFAVTGLVCGIEEFTRLSKLALRKISNKS